MNMNTAKHCAATLCCCIMQAAKKRNFNFWLWGGGFVAPFLATFYYFGFRFWER